METNPSGVESSIRLPTASYVAVDVRPNGNLVIEARQQVQDNDEIWEKALTGVIRREDVNPDNTVESDKVADMQLFKRERGAVRGAAARGSAVTEGSEAD